MPTRGRFVCHVHCLVHDGVVRSSPCRPHHENFGWNLYHMFVRAYSASQSFVLFWVWYSSCFKVKCGFHPFPKRCSHISMWIQILHDNRDCHVNPFHRCVSLQVNPITSISARSIPLILFFSSGFNSSFRCWSYSFMYFKCFSRAGAPHNHSFLAIQLFRSAQDISMIRVSTPHSFKIFRGCISF